MPVRTNAVTVSESELDRLAEDFFSQSADMAGLLDGERFLRGNARWQEVLGWSEEELKAKNMNEMIHEDDLEATGEAISKLHETGATSFAHTNRCLARDGSWHWLAWNSVLDPETNLAFVTVRDVTKEQTIRAEREELLATVSLLSEIQHRYIAEEGTSRSWWDFVLGELLSLTSAEFGFIGRVEHDEEGAPYLVTQAVTDIAWNEWSRKFYDEFAATGIEFRNLKSLFGATLSSGEAVIANEPAADARSGGLPEGHPPLNSYLGIPLKSVDGMVGMIGLANRSTGFDESTISRLQPIADALGQVLDTAATRRHNEAIRIERDLSTDALSISRSPKLAEALELTSATIAELHPGSASAFYISHRDPAQLARMDIRDDANRADFPTELHRASCLALEQGAAHLS
ncbi:unannotated protein [freshwater metagenome]|uniref:Unannotated protein n=1 Tax=freshwater metagenome TaxID=449393 RepID=A0A6J5ZSB3_9ZZZZ|nr:GAF domain-containing protein [Actinomycetota bacterium]